MNEMKAWEKYLEADYFLRMMKENSSNQDFFRYNLSAFLAAARSITLVLQKEFKNKKRGFNEWYEKRQEEMDKDEQMKFMNKKRVITIHKELIRPLGRHTVSIGVTAYISDSVEIKHIRNGKVIEECKSPSPPIKENDSMNNIKAEHKYYFPDYPTGEKEIIPACEEYLSKLHKILVEGENILEDKF